MVAPPRKTHRSLAARPLRRPVMRNLRESAGSVYTLLEKVEPGLPFTWMEQADDQFEFRSGPRRSRDAHRRIVAGVLLP